MRTSSPPSPPGQAGLVFRQRRRGERDQHADPRPDHDRGPSLPSRGQPTPPPYGRSPGPSPDPLARLRVPTTDSGPGLAVLVRGGHRHDDVQHGSACLRLAPGCLSPRGPGTGAHGTPPCGRSPCPWPGPMARLRVPTTDSGPGLPVLVRGEHRHVDVQL